MGDLEGSLANAANSLRLSSTNLLQSGFENARLVEQLNRQNHLFTEQSRSMSLLMELYKQTAEYSGRLMEENQRLMVENRCLMSDQLVQSRSRISVALAFSDTPRMGPNGRHLKSTMTSLL
ncbi:hypothetical protein Tsubulata_017098 [Turnera subulata]|uniref:Uncharacterized protein n=1 Tax=Turnera subulata TaxID=218843 RepID=A0A9Q0FJ75_9ROSI|nr:hypothetical protein Tsubulata_017098 [Turnera subulata]